jgi:excisionase family DNA binding protein
MVSSMRQDATSNGRDGVLDEVSDTDQHRTGLGQVDTSLESGKLATVHEAANALGVSVDAIRKRIQRGTIPHERHEDGRVYVLLDKARSMQDTSSTSSSTVPDEDEGERPVRYGTEEFIGSLQDQIGFLRRELERKDAILLRMAERIPELEASPAPPEPRDASKTVSEETGRGKAEGDSQEPVERRSWWRRFFGIE